MRIHVLVLLLVFAFISICQSQETQKVELMDGVAQVESIPVN